MKLMIERFASTHRLKSALDECWERIVPGKHGHIYEWNTDGSVFGVMFMPPKTPREPWGKWCPKRWGNFKRAGLALGMTVVQNGDSEGCLSFDPNDKAQVKLAIKIAGVRPKRRISPEQHATLTERLRSLREGQRVTVNA